MSVIFAPPTITGNSTEEQLKSMQSWLYQFSEQLQYTLNNLDTSNFSDGGLKEIVNADGVTQKSNAASEEFGTLKALIIKTADTIQSKYKEITETLESDYFAVSDFGEYSEMNKVDIVKSALGITQYFNRTESVESKLEFVEVGFNSYVKETNAFIRSGYSEQLKAYCIEIGQETTDIIDGTETVTFNQFATITAEEFAFWKDGVKLGYFNGDGLYVNSSIRIGRWSIDTSGGFTIKYV